MVYQKHICLLVTEDDKDIIGYDDSVGASIKERFRSVCGDALRFSTYEVVRGHFPAVIDEFDGYLVTGSHYCANDNLPWMLDLEEFLRQARNIPHIRIFGICFGHQFIAKSFGGRVSRNPSNKFTFSYGKVDVSPEFTAKSYFQSALCNRENFFIVQSHNDQVVVKPDGCTTMGWSPGCPYEVLSYGDNVLTMQGHPEINVDRMENITIPILKSKGMITDLDEKKVKKSLINDNGDELMTLISNFLRNC